MTGSVVTIETGLACNNRCAYCPQPVLRATGQAGCEPTTDELKQKLERARQEGILEAAFSGGEPTLRKDLPALVAHARAVGFDRVSVTTNGRMLAYPGYDRALLDAGLTGISLSLHGPDAGVHDALTGVPGSFGQAVAGLREMRTAARAARDRFELNTVTIMVPENLPFLRDTLVLAGSLGATLHVVQPFIVSRENLHLSDRFLLTQDALAAALRDLLAAPLPHGGRIKPYNVATCLVEDLASRIERQDYRLTTRREYEDAAGRKDGHVAKQFFRIEACEGCPHPCPGIRMEHLPQEELARRILDDASRREGGLRGRDATIASTDLLGSPGLDVLLGGLRAAGVGRLRLLWGGYARASIDDVLASCRAHRVDEVCLVAVPPILRRPDGRLTLPGNLDRLEEQVGRFGAAGVPSVSLFFVLNTLFEPDCRVDEAVLLRLAGGVRKAGGRALYLAAPDRLDPDHPSCDARELDRIGSALPALAVRIRGAGLDPVLLRCAGTPGRPDGSRLEDRVATVLPQARWDDEFLPHRYADSGFGWLMWSYPVWVRERA